MANLEIQPNTFYKKQFFDRDGFLSSTYSDRTLRDGLVSGSITDKSGSEKYIFNVTTPHIPKYGAYGTPVQQNLFLNIQDIVVENGFSTPVYKIYKRKKSLTLTTGSYTEIGSAAKMAVYTTQVDFKNAIMTESFDGVNKGFGLDVATQPQYEINATSEDNGQYILYSDVKAYAKKHELSITLLEAPTYGGNVKIQSPSFTGGNEVTVTDIGLGATSSYNTPRNRASGGPVGAVSKDRFLLKSERGVGGFGKTLSIRKYLNLHTEKFGYKYIVSQEHLTGTVAEFNARGLTVYTDKRITNVNRNIIEETSSQLANQYNTLFNVMKISPNYNDIKTQTLESTGDDKNPYAFSMCYFSGDDKVTGPQALVLDHFWENFSGSASTVGQRRKLNFPGTVDDVNAEGFQYPQEVTLGIANIPEIIPLEYGSGSTNTTSARPLNPTTTGEIEITFKVKSLGDCVKGNVSVSDVRAFNTLRSHNFILSSTPIEAEERFYDYIYRANNGPGFTGGAQMLGVGVLVSGSICRVYDMGGHYGGFVNGDNYIANGLLSTYVLQDSTFPATDFIDIKFDEWVTMKIKLDPQRKSQLAYFPDIKDSSGVIKSFKMEPSLDLVCSGSQSISALTINSSNWRSTNAGATVATSGNYGLSADSVLNTDQRNTLLIDNISFNNYNLNIKNCSELPDNLNNTTVSIPAPPMTVPKGRIGSTPETYLSTATDNYFLTETVPTCTTLNIGFPNVDWVPADVATVGHAFQFLFNGYTSINPQSNLINDALFRFGFSSGSSANGLAGIITGDNLFTGSGGRGVVSKNQTYPEYSVAGFPNAMDGAGQKGLLDFSVSGHASRGDLINPTLWVPRENPYVQARILQVHPDGYKIQVDNASILQLELGDNKSRFCIYQLGSPWDTSLAEGDPTEGFHSGFDSTKPLYITDIDDQNWVTLNKPFGSSFYDKVHRYAISPFMYWINITIFNGVYGAGDATPSIWGKWYKNPDATQFTLNGTRSYSAIQMISGSGDFGTTMNETTFTDARDYLHKQKLSVSENSDLEIQTDFGWGAFVPSAENTPEVPAGYIAKEIAVSGASTFLDMSGDIQTFRPPHNFESTYLIYPWDEDGDSSYKINIDTSTSTRNDNLYRPYMVYGYTDTLPRCGDLQVNPSVNLLVPESDLSKLTKSTATDLDVTWRENADDVWYRLLYVDNALVENKYHKVNFYAPLNESGPYLGTGIEAKWYTDYKDFPTGGTAFVSGTYAPVIDGFSGWGQEITGTANALKSSNASTPLGSASEFTFVMHCKPSTTDTRQIFGVSSSAAMNHCFEVQTYVEFDGSKYIKVRMDSDASNNTTLTSVSQYKFDGEQPLAIVVTYNKNRDSNNFRLYINGKLEDTNDYTHNFPASGQVFIGCSPDDWLGANPGTVTNGNIEEIFFSSKEAYVPQDSGQFTLTTKDLPDTTSNVSNNYQAKLFVMDYHNIRGSTYRDVAETNSTAWKITGVS